jgi:hypothetical protein
MRANSFPGAGSGARGRNEIVTLVSERSFRGTAQLAAADRNLATVGLASGENQATLRVAALVMRREGQLRFIVVSEKAPVGGLVLLVP